MAEAVFEHHVVAGPFPCSFSLVLPDVSHSIMKPKKYSQLFAASLVPLVDATSHKISCILRACEHRRRNRRFLRHCEVSPERQWADPRPRGGSRGANRRSLSILRGSSSADSVRVRRASGCLVDDLTSVCDFEEGKMRVVIDEMAGSSRRNREASRGRGAGSAVADPSRVAVDCCHRRFQGDRPGGLVCSASSPYPS